MFSNASFLCFCAVIVDGMHSNEGLFLTQNTFSLEILQHKFSIDSILHGLVANDEPVVRNSCAGELKQEVSEESIEDGRTDGRTDPSNCPEAVRKILIVEDDELEKRKESRIPSNIKINTSWAVRIWPEWAVERNGMIAVKSEKGITHFQVSPDILNITDNEELHYWPSKLVVEVRKERIQVLCTRQKLFTNFAVVFSDTCILFSGRTTRFN